MNKLIVKVAKETTKIVVAKSNNLRLSSFIEFFMLQIYEFILNKWQRT